MAARGRAPCLAAPSAHLHPTPCPLTALGLHPPCPQFVADGVFYAELNELLIRELAEDGYSGVDVRVTPLRTEIIIKATRTQNVLGRCGGGERECVLGGGGCPAACKAKGASCTQPGAPSSS